MTDRRILAMIDRSTHGGVAKERLQPLAAACIVLPASSALGHCQKVHGGLWNAGSSSAWSYCWTGNFHDIHACTHTQACTPTHTCTHSHKRVHTCTHTCMHTPHTHMHAHMYTCMHMHTHRYIHTHTCMCARMHRHTLPCMDAHSCMPMHRHTHTHTPIHGCTYMCTHVCPCTHTHTHIIHATCMQIIDECGFANQGR